MFRIIPRLLSIVCILTSVAVVAQGAAAAASRPYSSRGTAQFVSPTQFVGSGQATHLGRYSEAGEVAFSPTATPGVFSVAGSIVYTAANGDELHATVSGELNGATGAVTATIGYSGGTGRFRNASGSSTLTGQVLPDGTLSVSVRGSISY